MSDFKIQLCGNAVARSVKAANDRATSSSQHEFDFPGLPAEIRNCIYDFFVLPPTTITKLYPPRATDRLVPAPALAYASHEIGRESMPIIYRDVDLVLRPRPGFGLLMIPRSLMRAMPNFAPYVNTLTVELVYRAPPLPVTGNAAPRDVLMQFEMDSNKVFKITASADDPMTEYGREKVLESAKKMATEMEALLVGYLQEDAVLKKTLVEAEDVHFFTWTTWVSPDSL